MKPQRKRTRKRRVELRRRKETFCRWKRPNLFFYIRSDFFPNMFMNALFSCTFFKEQGELCSFLIFNFVFLPPFSPPFYHPAHFSPHFPAAFPFTHFTLPILLLLAIVLLKKGGKWGDQEIFFRNSAIPEDHILFPTFSLLSNVVQQKRGRAVPLFFSPHSNINRRRGR